MCIDKTSFFHFTVLVQFLCIKLWIEERPQCFFRIWNQTRADSLSTLKSHTEILLLSLQWICIYKPTCKLSSLHTFFGETETIFFRDKPLNIHRERNVPIIVGILRKQSKVMDPPNSLVLCLQGVFEARHLLVAVSTLSSPSSCYVSPYDAIRSWK